jgi:hypothetical protein
MSRVIVLIGALCLLSLSRTASAYPQFIFNGFGDCGDCHHSPTGGRLPNRWGRESIDVSFDGDSGVGWGNDDLTYGKTDAGALKVDLGLDIRLMPLFQSDGDATQGTLIPMLTELGGAAALGRWTLYGTVTARPLAGSGIPYAVMSREHWLKYHASEGLDVRLGRLVLPFGIRQPDHTQYVREDFELDKYDQSYGAEVDFRGALWSVFGSVFAGDLTGRPRERQERGLALTTIRELGNAALGLSALGATSTARTRLAGSLFGRSPLGASTYVLAEAAMQHFAASDTDASLSTLADYVRLGWFVKPALDLYLEGGHRAFLNAEGLTKLRAGLGLNWQVLRWFEFAPQVLAESRTGLPTRFVAMGQLHLMY